eukprot:6463913-Amphidinium_carterae.1
MTNYPQDSDDGKKCKSDNTEGGPENLPGLYTSMDDELFYSQVQADPQDDSANSVVEFERQ